MGKTPNATPNAFTFLELGVLPIEYEINKRQLVFLYHILTLPKSDPVYKLHEKQKLLKYEKNWANNLEEQSHLIHNLMCTQIITGDVSESDKNLHAHL